MISVQHRTIFIHIPKTAGQSIELAFLKDLDLAWTNREALLLRFNNDRQAGPERLAHLFAREYLKYHHISPEDFESFFKFSVVRNPYDRAVSAFNFRDGSGFKTIRDFLSSIPDDPYDDRWRHACPQCHYLMDDARENILVDEVLKFEELKLGWSKISRRIFGGDRELPYKNRSKAHLELSGLSKADLDFVSERYSDDFRLFGYEMLS